MDLKTPESPPVGIGSGRQRVPVSPTVLLLVDVINPLEFPEADALAPAAAQAARQTARLKEALSLRRVRPIYANDHYGLWHSEFRDVRAHCLQQGGVAKEMACVLAPGPDDFTVLKPRHSAFLGTPLELLLAQMKCRRLVIAGLSTDMCVQMTAMDAYLRGYKLWVPQDCSAAETPQRHQTAIDYMEQVLKADVRPSTRGRPGARRLPLPQHAAT